MVGVDEAGLGPNLGPFVLAAVAFTAPAELDDGDWWPALAPAFVRKSTARARSNDRFIAPAAYVVDDSKRVLAQRQGALHLARAALSLGDPAFKSTTLAGLLERFDPTAAAQLRSEHWHSADSDGDDPLAAMADRRTWTASLARAGLLPMAADAAVLFPAEFNARLAAGANKSELESAAVAGLLQGLFSRLEPLRRGGQCERMVVHVDRLGGRKNYRTLVEDIAGADFPTTVEEAPHLSRYAFSRDDMPCEIAFAVRADAACFPVALASMLAKYLRERCMAQFNAFWTARVAGLKPTAGYPTDARRFFAAIRPRLEELGMDASHIWRRK